MEPQILSRAQADQHESGWQQQVFQYAVSLRLPEWFPVTLRRVPPVPADGVTLVAPRRRPRADSMWVTQLTVDILLARLILALSSRWNWGSSVPQIGRA